MCNVYFFKYLFHINVTINASIYPQKKLWWLIKFGKLVKDVFENKSLFDCNYCLIIWKVFTRNFPYRNDSWNTVTVMNIFIAFINLSFLSQFIQCYKILYCINLMLIILMTIIDLKISQNQYLRMYGMYNDCNLRHISCLSSAYLKRNLSAMENLRFLWFYCWKGKNGKCRNGEEYLHTGLEMRNTSTQKIVKDKTPFCVMGSWGFKDSIIWMHF